MMSKLEPRPSAQPRRDRRSDPLSRLGREALCFGPVRVPRASDRGEIAKALCERRAASRRSH
jgi:hypothetical protein